MKAEEIRSKTESELDYEKDKLEKELFEMRFKAGMESLASPARIRQARRSIARIKTIVHERSKGIRGQEPRPR